MKRSAAALRDADIRFALMGSLALWARSGKRPSTTEDIDFAIREQDLVKAARVLEDAGFTIEVPEEDWLIKAWAGDPSDKTVFIDLIYAPSGLLIDDEVLDRADLAPVLALDVRVLSATDVLATKLAALNQQSLNYVSSLEMARVLREQIDWDLLEERTVHSPYAEAFFLLARRLGVDPRGTTDEQIGNVLEHAGSRPQRTFPHRRQLMDEMKQRNGGVTADAVP